MSGGNDAENVFKNLLIVVSNLPFILPGLTCLRLGKHVQAFVFFSVLVTSSLYHACKFGSEDEASPWGICVIFDYDVYFVMDHAFAMLTIPCLLLSLSPLDVTIFDFRLRDEKTSSSSSSLSSTFSSRTKDELKDFLFENGFSSFSYYAVNAPITKENEASSDVVMRPPRLLTAYRPTFEITRDNVLSSYKRNSKNGAVLKSTMDGLENVYVLIYAYVIVAALIASYPNFAFSAALCASSLCVALAWGGYFYFKHRVVAGFKKYEFSLGLVLVIAASSLMLAQDNMPKSTYWITHSVWHVCAALGQWLLLEAKYRFACYY